VSSHPGYQQSLSYLFSLQKFGVKLGLSNIEALMEGLGNPHLRYPSILIGGTNGKGSTAAFLDSILREAGFCVGLYTSPHLLDFRERIRVDGVPVGEGQIVEGMDHLSRLISSLMVREPSAPLRLSCHPTFFEVSTALAFDTFAKRGVEVAVVEVGMGGRYDATNILHPLFSIITNVDLDHQEYLGGDLRQIAVEKAGIIKDGGGVVSGVSRPEAAEVIRRIAREREARIYNLGTDVTWRVHRTGWDGQEISIQGLKAAYPYLKIHLLGGHQAANAAAAVAAAELFQDQGFRIAQEAISEGLAKARWPGRMQVVNRHPLIVVDSAHNPAGAQILSRAMLDLDDYRRLYLVFGVLRDKNWREMLELLGSLADEIILTEPPSERAADPYFLKEELTGKVGRMEVRKDIGEAIHLAKSLAQAEDVILITGSIFTAAEALRALGVHTS
jgi:dihydrofolate synthase/folylpolyglutamate synthase